MIPESEYTTGSNMTISNSKYNLQAPQVHKRYARYRKSER